MLYHIRRVLSITILLAFVAAAWLAWHSTLRLFIPSGGDTLTIALYLLSTVIQSLAAILGITVAVLFITAQVTTRAQYGRLLRDIYKDRTTYIFLSFYFLAITSGVILLSEIGTIVKLGNFRWLDLHILVSITAVVLLLPLILVQIENINPYLLAVKLSKRITVKRILAYKLVQISFPAGQAGKAEYRLVVWGHLHGRDDPLGPFHEIIMGTVQARDRVTFSALIRLLLQRVAKISSVPYPSKPLRPNSSKRWLAKVSDHVFTTIPPLNSLENRLAVALHILHYIVRRTCNLRSEWGDLDTMRQQAILNIRDLITTLCLRRDSSQLIEVCLYATMHICLGYEGVRRYGQHEALSEYYDLSNILMNSGKPEEADLCVQILAVLAERTSQIPLAIRGAMEAQIHPSLVESYRKYINIARANQQWIPGSEIRDPWRYRVPDYNSGIRTQTYTMSTATQEKLRQKVTELIDLVAHLTVQKRELEDYVLKSEMESLRSQQKSVSDSFAQTLSAVSLLETKLSELEQGAKVKTNEINADMALIKQQLRTIAEHFENP